MDQSEIEKALAAFEAKLKPIFQAEAQPEPVQVVATSAPKKKTAKVKIPPAPLPVADIGAIAQAAIFAMTPPPPVQEPTMEVPCLNKPFKDMIGALGGEYVGNATGKPFLVMFMDTQVEECAVH